MTISRAETAAELRAAACLRAYAFYTYPPGRSEWAERSHRRMKADAEWEALQAKVAGSEPSYAGVRVECWVATIPDDPACPVAAEAAKDMEPSSKLPADPAAGHPAARIVIGTLDVNTGRNLPAEELQGRLPPAGAGSGSPDPATARAYLSNVCVAKAARRRGVAAALIKASEQGAAQQGVSHMYVHVVHDNAAAVTLYQQALGFRVEAEESQAFARAASRPRRLLLHKQLR